MDKGMDKGRRPTASTQTPWSRWAAVLVGLALAGALVWFVAKPGADEAAEEAAADGMVPQPLETGGPSVAAAAAVDAPAESLASSGPDAPSGVNISNDPRIGTADAPVTIVAFSDFECPHCADFHANGFPALRTLYGDKIRWVFVNRFFAGPHPQAERAAMAAECAGRQGKFWEYATLVFENQMDLKPSAFDGFASQVGIGEAAFKQCLGSGETASEVAADQAEGDRLAVDGTPTFFVNGHRIVGAQPVTVFSQVIAPYVQ